MRDRLESAVYRRLLRAGIAPRHARRAANELGDHLDDLATDALRQGASRAKARRQALRRLGSMRSIAADYAARSELKRWYYRHPAAARALLPVVLFAEKPLAVFEAGVEAAPWIARWLACAATGALVTAVLLLAMQLSITAG